MITQLAGSIRRGLSRAWAIASDPRHILLEDPWRPPESLRLGDTMVALRLAVTWFFAAGVAMFVVLLGDAALRPELGWSAVAQSENLRLWAQQSLQLTWRGCALVVSLHALNAALYRWLPWASGCSAPGLALAAWQVALTQARFLTSGDSIAAHPLVGWIRLGFVIALTAIMLALWFWHLHLLRSIQPAQPAQRPWWPAVLEHPLVRSLSLSVGAIAAGVGVAAITARMTFYAFFAEFTLWLIWFMAATVSYHSVFGAWLKPASQRRPVDRWLRGGSATAAGLWLAIACFGARPAQNFNTLTPAAVLSDHRLATVAHMAVDDAPLAPDLAIDIRQNTHLHCEETPEPEKPPRLPLSKRQRRNVIMISVDALRRDVLFHEIDHNPVAPNLRAFAEESVIFERASTTYPATLFALGSAVTGTYPSEMLFSPEILPSIFQHTGDVFKERALLFPSSRWFRMPIIQRLIVQGMRFHLQSDGRDQTDEFIHWLDYNRKHNQRLFAWVHFMEPHTPFRKHEPYDYGDSSEARYLSEVSMVDEYIGEILEKLREDGWFDDSLVIIFADHGEAVGELGYYGHHVYLQDWISDIPMLVRAPGLDAGSIHTPVSLIDLPSTIAHFKNIAPAPHYRGNSLFEITRRERHGETNIRSAPVVVEAFPIRGTQLFRYANEPPQTRAALETRIDEVRTTGRNNYDPKVAIADEHNLLIANRHTGVPQLYPRGGHTTRGLNLAANSKHAETAQRMRKQLAAWYEDTSERVACRFDAWLNRPPPLPPEPAKTPETTKKPPAQPSLPKAASKPSKAGKSGKSGKSKKSRKRPRKARKGGAKVRKKSKPSAPKTRSKSGEKNRTGAVKSSKKSNRPTVRGSELHP